MSFWISVVGLLALALAILLIPLVRGSHLQQGDQRRQQNIQIAREKKQLLDAQLEQAEIDQSVYDGAYLDLQASLALELEPRETGSEKSSGIWMAMVVLLAIPLASVTLYFAFGEYRVIEDPMLAQAASAQPVAPQMNLEEMLTAIKGKLRENPDDPSGWYALGRTFMAKQQYDHAVTAFQRAYDLLGDKPGILFSLADALAMQNKGNLLGEPEQLVLRGLELAPRYPNGLWLAGLAAEQRQDYKSAHRYWTLLLPLITDNPGSVREVKNMIAMLEQLDPNIAKPAIATAQITIALDISPELNAQAKPEQAVFVYAKAMQGPPMPLAVKKLRLADLPISITLSDDDAMLPSMKLSSFKQVILGARVSISGNPVAQTGDFYTEIEGVDSSDPPPDISLVIDQIKK